MVVLAQMCVKTSPLCFRYTQLQYLCNGANALCDKFNGFSMDPHPIEDVDIVAHFNSYCYYLLIGMKAKVILRVVGGENRCSSMMIRVLFEFCRLHQ